MGRKQLLGLLAAMQARDDAADEAHAPSWIVMVTDPETGDSRMFGPWPKKDIITVAAWADALVKQFSSLGDDGVPLKAIVYPLFTPEEGDK